MGNRNEQLQAQASDEYVVSSLILSLLSFILINRVLFGRKFQGVKINKFDVIKLGRMKFRIKELVCANSKHNQEEIQLQDLKEAH